MVMGWVVLMISCLVVVVWKLAIRLMEVLVRAINLRCVFRRMSLGGFLRVSLPLFDGFYLRYADYYRSNDYHG